jgi:predicted transposase/invertase (TIGR01784 family)
LDQWIYYLKNNKILDNFTAQGLDKAREVLAFDKMSEEEKKQYWRNIEERRTKDSEIRTARHDGRAEGEKLKTIEIAKRAKTRGMPFDQINEITNLSIEEIEKL